MNALTTARGWGSRGAEHYLNGCPTAYFEDIGWSRTSRTTTDYNDEYFRFRSGQMFHSTGAGARLGEKWKGVMEKFLALLRIHRSCRPVTIYPMRKSRPHSMMRARQAPWHQGVHLESRCGTNYQPSAAEDTASYWIVVGPEREIDRVEGETILWMAFINEYRTAEGRVCHRQRIRAHL